MAFSGLPLPKVVYDVEAGGPFITGARGVNAFNKERLENEYQGIKNKYAPLSLQAKAASELAYASLMGPQYVAKLMGNEHIVANLTPEQRQQALDTVTKAGLSHGIGSDATQPSNPLANLPNIQNTQNKSPLSRIVDEVRNVFGFNKNAAQPAEQGQNPLANLSEKGMEPVNVNPIMGNEPNSEIAKATNAWMQSPEALDQAKKEGMYTIPQAPQLLNWYRNKQSTAPQPPGRQGPNTYAENVGTYKGRVTEGEEAGKIRAKDIGELNDTVYNSDTKLTTLYDLNKMVASPIIREIRQLPLAGQHEIGWYAKEGTPAQQQLIGRIKSQFGTIVKDSSRDFAGQFRKGEQQLLNGMKPNESDTVDVMIGKLESLTVMTKLLRERSALISRIMSEQHVDKLHASDIADKQVNGDAIRDQVHDQLNPMLTIENEETGERMTLPAAEARKKMKGSK
jgi:hypothetical protein